MLLPFFVYALRLSWEARETISFPSTAANCLRGGWGWQLAQLQPLPGEAAPYARYFAPRWESGPSGLRNAPRPFVLRAAHLDGAAVAPGGLFHFDIHWFSNLNDFLDIFLQLIQKLGDSGLTRRGFGRANLVSADSLSMRQAPARTVWRDGRVCGHPLPITLDLADAGTAVDSLTVRFLTPTELKQKGAPAAEPGFALLFARIRDRISTLRALYQVGPLEIDFRAAAQRAAQVITVRSALRRWDAGRVSHSSGQRHPLGGWVGEVEFAGHLGEFIPYLEAARFTGAGRQTVWGNGAIDCEAPGSSFAGS